MSMTSQSRPARSRDRSRPITGTSYKIALVLAAIDQPLLLFQAADGSSHKMASNGGQRGRGGQNRQKHQSTPTSTPNTVKESDKENSLIDGDKLDKLIKVEMAKKADELKELAKIKSQEVAKILKENTVNISKASVSSAPKSVTATISKPVQVTATITQPTTEVHMHYPYRSPASTQNTMNVIPPYLQSFDYLISPIRHLCKCNQPCRCNSLWYSMFSKYPSICLCSR